MSRKPFLAVLSPFIHFIDLFLFLRTYTCFVYSSPWESQRSCPEALLPNFMRGGRVDADEGRSRIPQPGTSTKRIVHRDFPRGRMHIDTKIEEVEEDRIETSDDESADDETYRMSPMQASKNSTEEDEDNGSEERHESAAEKEEEGMVEGTLNPRSHRRDPFDLSPTIRIPHKSLWFVVTSYKGKGATKRVKKL
jgi:hypothetical protein